MENVEALKVCRSKSKSKKTRAGEVEHSRRSKYERSLGVLRRRRF